MEESNFITAFITCPEVFSGDECKNIIALYKSDISVVPSPADVLDGTFPGIESRIIYNRKETKWLFDKIKYSIYSLNSKTLNINVSEMELFVQVFKIKKNDFFSWQKDIGISNNLARKISFILLLSKPGNYEGGEIKWFGNEKPEYTDKDLKKIAEVDNPGTIFIFPSYQPYKLEPLKWGEKYILMTWALGPAFY